MRCVLGQDELHTYVKELGAQFVKGGRKTADGSKSDVAILKLPLAFIDPVQEKRKRTRKE